MIPAKELTMGNLVIWNPKLTNPNSTLSAMLIEVSGVMPDKITYVFPNIENRVEPFEDDVAQTGGRVKSLQEIEGIELTSEILQNVGFKENDEALKTGCFEKGPLQLKAKGNHFELLDTANSNNSANPSLIMFFHQLQNLYSTITGEELEIRLHGQQA